MSYNLVDPTTGELTQVAGGGFSIPVGTLISQYKKVPMSGYLYCDGSTFDENAYPALYMYLGTNVLPDYRECVMVGAEQNTTDTIATHDVYGEGEFKDDQIQDIGKMKAGATSGHSLLTGGIAGYVTSNSDLRVGETTHGKQKAVYVYIKATSGLAENQQENVLNDVKGYVDDKIAHEVDTSYMSNGVLNISSIRQSLGVGCYEIMGQGNSGHGSIRLNIWQVVSGTFAFSCCITDTSGVRSICDNEGSSPTVDVGTSYFNTTNKIIKIF